MNKVPMIIALGLLSTTSFIFRKPFKVGKCSPQLEDELRAKKDVTK